MSETVFIDHTLESAPAGSRRPMEATIKHGGYLPSAVARLASSPQLLDGFLKLGALFEGSTLEPLAREVVILTIATRNECHLCVAMHTAKLHALGADADLVNALRSSSQLPEPGLDLIRRFTLEVLDTAGAVNDSVMQEFLAGGYNAQNALEVVLGIGAYTTSTFANRMTNAPVDEALEPFAWPGHATGPPSETDQ